jgi:glycosyltransferase involved in cell wall biosynthesis
LDGAVPESWRQRVFIHSTVPNAELLSRIAEHDVGLALETTAIKSRDLTVTNKLFQYLQAGLAIIATDTAGQREVFARRPDIGTLIPPDDPGALARAIEALFTDAGKLGAARAAALSAAEEEFCWEKQQLNLVAAAEAALQAKAPKPSSSNLKLAAALQR